MTKEEVNTFLNSTYSSFAFTPYAPYLQEAIEYNRVRNRELLYTILKDPNVAKEARTKAQKKLKSSIWDKPRIVSILDLKSHKESEFNGFDYETEVRKTMHFLLKESPGLLIENPKHIYHEIQSKPTGEALRILLDELKGHEEKIRIQKLIDLDQFPTDEFLIAKYISADVDDKVVAKIWDRDPKKDMSRDDELYCCTLPKYGPEYLADPNISMMDFFCDGERDVRAFLVPCEDRFLMVDSVERNSRIIDNHHSHQNLIRNFVARNILNHAGECGFETVFFNAGCYKTDVLPEKIHYELPSVKLTLRPIFRVRGVDRESDYYIEGFKSEGNTKHILKEFFTRKYEVIGKEVNVGENIETED